MAFCEKHCSSIFTRLRADMREAGRPDLAQHFENLAMIIERRRQKQAHWRPPTEAALFCWPRFWFAGQHGIVGNQRQATTFEPQRRLHQGCGQAQQGFAMPFRFGLVGPTQTFFRELTKFLGR
jgi:hypothetical protein